MMSAAPKGTQRSPGGLLRLGSSSQRRKGSGDGRAQEEKNSSLFVFAHVTEREEHRKCIVLGLCQEVLCSVICSLKVLLLSFVSMFYF